jgi:hypothetical protein
MKTRKFDKYLFWLLILVILLVALVFFITARPAAAASVCGPLVGNANLVETALTVANVPHQVYADAQSIASCMAIGCPKPRTICRGFGIRLQATSARWVSLYFGMSGKFVGVR